MYFKSFKKLFSCWVFFKFSTFFFLLFFNFVLSSFNISQLLLIFDTFYNRNYYNKYLILVLLYFTSTVDK